MIDFDSKMPNLALMQISSYHKSKKDIVGFDIDDPDIVYISCIFRRNKAQAIGVSTFYPDSRIYLGGSGINYSWLPENIQRIYPDYELYDMNYSIGFTTRGCIRKCPWCIVPEKEGKFRRWQHTQEFYNSKFDTIMWLDNNILVDKDWFFKNADFILSKDLRLIEHGFDIRLLDKDSAQRIAEIKFSGKIHFAFDSLKDESAVRAGIKLLKDVGIDIRNDVMFYVLVGYNTTEEEDKYRCRLLKELNTNPFVMPFVKNKWTNKIARWANRKEVFWTCDIDDYTRKKR